MTAIKTLQCLIIDANPDDAVLLERRLAEMDARGFEVTQVGSSDQALRHLQNHWIDMVFLDYRLDNGQEVAETGVDVVTRLRDSGHLLPVVALTAAGDEYIAASLIKAGADDYLSKKHLMDTRAEKVIRLAIELGEMRREAHEASLELRERLDNLTKREREVLSQLVEGRTSRQIAEMLHRSIETIKVHRAHILDKMRVASTAELIRLVTASGITFDEA